MRDSESTAPLRPVEPGDRSPQDTATSRAAYHHTPPPPKNDGPLDIQFACSRDGVRWLRPDRRPIISLGFDGAWNGGSLYAGYGLSRRANELSLYYTAYDVTHAFNPKGEWTYQHLLSVNGTFSGISRDDLLAGRSRRLCRANADAQRAAQNETCPSASPTVHSHHVTHGRLALKVC